MKRYAVFLDRFTSNGLDEMKRKDRRSPAKVLKALSEHPRFSVFEATANQVVANTMTYLVDEKLIEVDNSPGYPWSIAIITDKGRAYMKSSPAL